MTPPPRPPSSLHRELKRLAEAELDDAPLDDLLDRATQRGLIGRERQLRRHWGPVTYVCLLVCTSAALFWLPPSPASVERDRGVAEFTFRLADGWFEFFRSGPHFEGDHR